MKKTSDELREIKLFGAVLAGILTVFGSVHYIKHHVALSQKLFVAGLIVLFVVLLSPRTLKPAYSLFLKVSHAIGWFNTRVILILIYFLFITPIAIAMRVFGKDPFGGKMGGNTLTYWARRLSLKAVRERLEKQF